MRPDQKRDSTSRGKWLNSRTFEREWNRVQNQRRGAVGFEGPRATIESRALSRGYKPLKRRSPDGDRSSFRTASIGIPGSQFPRCYATPIGTRCLAENVRDDDNDDSSACTLISAVRIRPQRTTRRGTTSSAVARRTACKSVLRLDSVQ